MKSLVFAFSLLAAAVSNAQVSAAGAAQAALDPFARDYIARLDAAGSGPGPNTAPISHLVAGLRARGLWDKLAAACLLAGPDSLSGALVPLRADMPTPTAFNFVAGDYSRATGLKGNGASKYLTTGLSGTALAQNSAHLATWVHEAHVGAVVGCYIGNARTSVAGGAILLSRSGVNPGSLATQLHGGVDSSVSGGASVGFVAISRSGGTSYTARRGGSEQIVADASVAPLNRSIHVFRLDQELGYATARLSFYSIGEALDLAQLDALLTTYVGSLQ